MVTKIHKDAIRGEIANLREMLNGPASKDRLGALSLRQRLTNLEKQLASDESQAKNVASVALIFDGGAVRGSSAIDADFAGKALQEYQELVTKQMAHSDLGGLAQRGPLPAEQHRRSRLNVTDLVHGSFGFVLEEDGSDQSELFESATMLAVSEVTDILSGVSSDSSVWFDKKLPELDARLFKTLKKFVSLLHKSSSTLKISEEKREIRIDSVGVLRAFNRVSHTEIDENDESVFGELLGIAPIQRRFDFRRGDSSEVISGAVAWNLSADYLRRIERDELIVGRSWHAVIRTKTVQPAEGRVPSLYRTLVDLVPADEPVRKIQQ